MGTAPQPLVVAFGQRHHLLVDMLDTKIRREVVLINRSNIR